MLYTELVHKCVVALASLRFSDHKAMDLLLNTLKSIKKGATWDSISNPSDDSTFLMWLVDNKAFNRVSERVVAETITLLRRDLYGDTILNHAIVSQNIEAVAFILDAAQQHGSLSRLVDSINIRGEYALAFAVQSQNIMMVNTLLESGARILNNQSVITVLHQASFGSLDIFKALCESLKNTRQRMD